MGYRGYPECTACNCNINGTREEFCDKELGLCSCEAPGNCVCKVLQPLVKLVEQTSSKPTWWIIISVMAYESVSFYCVCSKYALIYWSVVARTMWAEEAVMSVRRDPSAYLVLTRPAAAPVSVSESPQTARSSVGWSVYR